MQGTVGEIKSLLAEAKALLEGRTTWASAFIQSLAILFREGLEAILVLAVVFKILSAMGYRGFQAYLAGGVLAAVGASFATWYVADQLISVSTADRELIEGITGLLAAAVLVYVSHWLFHRTYVEGWTQFVRH